jgi:4-diphosphocytidyl-2-C-methyl-D-erythritol kinase
LTVPSRIRLRAFAKINLGLRIIAKRQDGFHDIETVFHQIDLSDELAFDHAPSLSFQTSSENVPADESNLVFRAALLLKNQFKINSGAAIELKKSIPVGAGLGGGSVDGAVALVGLNNLWKLGLSNAQLLSLASQLGSDVPFFINGGTAIGKSRGEVLEPLDISIPYWIVTVTPRVHVSTSWAYANLKLASNRSMIDLRTVVEKGMNDLALLRSQLTNDFENLVFGSYPRVRELRDELLSNGAGFAQMTGSGSSVYGLFENEINARSCATLLSRQAETSLTSPGFKAHRHD